MDCYIQVFFFNRQLNKNKFPASQFFELNGMHLTSPEQVYKEMWFLLSGGRTTTEIAKQLLDKRFSKSTPNNVPTVFILDELDMLVQRKQSVLYNIFNWSNREGANLILLCISNRMNLPDEVSLDFVGAFSCPL